MGSYILQMAGERSDLCWWAAAAYLLAANLAGFILMAVDKSRARRHRWRIPERTLFLVSLLGGSLGVWCGMYLFRHKTKHWYFVIGIPAILALWLAIIWICLSRIM